MHRELQLPAAVLQDLALAHPADFPALFDSAAGGDLGRYSVLAAYPQASLVLHADQAPRAAESLHADRPAEADHPSVPLAPDGGFLSSLDLWWRALRLPHPEIGAPLPFTGGWVLFLAYELASEIEPTLALPRPPQGPLAIALRVPCGLAVEHATGRVFAFAEAGCDALLDRLCAAAESTARDRAQQTGHTEIALSIAALREDEPEKYLAAVRAAQAYIAAGDVYQVNLSRAWRAEVRDAVAARALYGALRRSNPAPFAGLFQWRDFSVLSSSPERLVRSERGVAHTRPIAGTRPRSGIARDAAGEIGAMVASAKERAEHIMLVDLERNDLGRVCERGSVRVEELMTVESYPHVHHIVSKVSGTLRAETSPVDLIRAVFPGGTITGCPKHRCMQIIAELEGQGRGAYTGSMGWLDRNGDLDLNILIRTLTVANGTLEFRTGAGIVADSEPLAELAETRAKARAMLAAIESLTGTREHATRPESP